MRLASVVLLAVVGMSSVAAPVPKKPAPNYFPCALGTKWEYAKEGEKEACLVIEVTEAEEKGGVRTVTFDQTGGEKFRDYPERYRLDADGVFMTVGSGKDITPPRLDLRAKPKADDTWESPHEWSGWTFAMTVTVGDEEEVQVPAGKFAALPHAQAFVVNRQDQAWKAWFAPGVGRVKFVNYDGTVYVLLRYSAGKDK